MDGAPKKRQADGGNGEWSDNKRAREDGGEERQIALKFLLSNQQAGTIIGRAGSTIAALQNKSNARIKVSSANDYFPGTQQRCVLILGNMQTVASASEHLLLELFRDSESYKGGEKDADGDDIINVTLLLPDLSCGQIIGKGGENIRKMVEQSGAQIKLAAKESQVPGIPERVLTNTGKLAQVIKATDLVLHKLWEHEKTSYTIMNTTYKGAGGAYPPPQGGGGRFGGDGYAGAYPPAPFNHGGGGYHDVYPSPGQYQGAYPPYAGGPPAPPFHQPPRGGGGNYRGGAGGGPPAGGADWGPGRGAGAAGGGGGGMSIPHTDVTYTVQVPDHVVPLILGKGGQVIREMIDLSGATIKVSQKGEYAPGTTNRTITITGAAHAASYAHQLVSAKIPLA